jgi:Mce-associated membrane protein
VTASDDDTTTAAAQQEPSAPESDGDVLLDDGATQEPSDGAPAGGRRDRLRLALLASAVGLVLLLVAALYLGFQLRSQAQDEAARRDALAAARQSALNLTSIDKDNFADDVASVIDGATGEFRSDFAARADDLERLLTENEVVADGEVLEAGIVRSDRRSATALVVVDSTVSNTQTPDGRVNSYRMKLELEKVGDRWLTSVLEFVG